LNFIYPKSISELYQVFKFLKPISQYYPNFHNWYWDNVIPGTILTTDKIIVIKNKYNLIGVSIVKDTQNEKKIRTLRIAPKYQNAGISLSLIDKSLEVLKTDKPVASVAEELFHDYARIFINKYNFELTHVYKGIYRKGKLEYEFNGTKNLKKKQFIFKE